MERTRQIDFDLMSILCRYVEKIIAKNVHLDNNPVMGLSITAGRGFITEPRTYKRKDKMKTNKWVLG